MRLGISPTMRCSVCGQQSRVSDLGHLADFHVSSHRLAGAVGGAASCLVGFCCLGPPTAAPCSQNLNPRAPWGGAFLPQNLLTQALPLLSLPLAIAVDIIRVPARRKDVILPWHLPVT